MKKLSRNLAMYICMFVAVFCVMTMKAEAANVTSGTLGNSDGISWSYDADTKTLTLTGDNTLEEMFWFGEDSLSGICMDVKTIVVKDCKVDTCRGMFDGLTSLEKVIFDNFDTSQVTDMRYMFHACSSLSELDVSDFDTGKVTNMSYMFCGCVILSEPDISGFDTSQVTNMRYMFCGCENIDKLDVSGFDTGKVTDMRGMFFGCKNVEQLDVSGFDTSQVTDMESMFDACNNIKKLDVSGFDTSQVTNMNYMFCACSSLQELDLNSFDITKVTDKTGMFSSCDSLMKIKAPKSISDECTIELPDTYVDGQGNQTDCLTKAFCNKTLYKQGEGQVRAFVERMYTVALGRTSDPSGINYWTEELLAHRKDGASISAGFIMSEEFEKKNYSNEEYLKVLYRTFFDREADTGGMNFWLEQMKAGRSRKSVLAGFVNSKEFTDICAAYGIDRGTMADDATATGTGRFVERLYTIAFERPSDSAGLEAWTQRINDKTVTPEQVAKEFFLSPEYIEKNTSNDKYVETLYLVFMDRASESTGKAYWVGQLNNGMSRESVLEGFAQSQEFKEIMARYGL